MSAITKNANVGVADSAPFDLNNGVIITTEATAGEAIAVMDAVRLTAASGWIRCDAGEGGFDGFAVERYAAGEKVTALGNGVIIEYSDASAMTVGALVYRGANGALDDAQTGSDPAIGKVIEDNKIIVINAYGEAASS